MDSSLGGGLPLAVKPCSRRQSPTAANRAFQLVAILTTHSIPARRRAEIISRYRHMRLTVSGDIGPALPARAWPGVLQRADDPGLRLSFPAHERPPALPDD